MKSTWMALGIATIAWTFLPGCAEAPEGEDDGVLGGEVESGDVGAAGAALHASPIIPVTPSDVYIESISTGGVGCPDPSTVSTVISSDRTSFLVIFDEMILENPGGSPIKNINCVAGVKLHIPNGYQFSVATIDTRGYAYLSPGIRGRQTSQYFFAGIPLSTQYHSSLVGPYDRSYNFTDEIPFHSVVWSPCGGSAVFAINTSLNLNATQNPGGLAYFNTETVDGKFRKIVHWEWRPC